MARNHPSYCRSHKARRGMRYALLAGLSGVMLPAAAMAADGLAVGSRNVTNPDAPLARPDVTPCVVPLFTDEAFGEKGLNTSMEATPTRFHYAPPAFCAGPFAKIVLEADYQVDAGDQYDRTTSIWLKGVNIFFGTTAMPRPGVPLSWHVERDLTDYASLFQSDGDGAVLVNNWLDALRASVIHASAKLVFYPATTAAPAPATPAIVASLAEDRNAPSDVRASANLMERSLQLPRNMDRIYLDIIAQSQLLDEFWYRCLPDSEADKVSSFAMRRGYTGAPKIPRACGGGNFREVEVSIDGKPAGVAPVFPWVYTGGLDTHFWQPATGVQTLNFQPYRLDLTPFAGPLNDGRPHRIGVHVAGVTNFFSIAATLLAYTDDRVDHLDGGLTRNTLPAGDPDPRIVSTLAGPSDGAHGAVSTTLSHGYVLDGYLDTPDGRRDAHIEQKIAFSNVQTFKTLSASQNHQVMTMKTATQAYSRISGGKVRPVESRDAYDYGLIFDEQRNGVGSDVTQRQLGLSQWLDKQVRQSGSSPKAYSAHFRSAVTAGDSVTMRNGQRGSTSAGQHSSQSVSFKDTLGHCYDASISVRQGAVDALSSGKACPGGAHKAGWDIHMDGAPE